MPRRLSGILIFLLVSVIGWAQGESTFLHTDDYRMKLEVAKLIRLDTLPDFKVQEVYYKAALEGIGAGKIQSKSIAQKGEWVKIASITRNLPQHISKEQEQIEKQRMDSIYNALMDGADFENMAKTYSSDGDGSYKWMPISFLLQEWISALSTLNKDKISRPFYSPRGIHIIRWEERGMRKVESDVSVDLPEYIEWERIREALMVGILEKKYKKALQYSEKDLENYFKEHRKEYAWDLPHYRGVVIHCKDKKEGKRILKWLKAYPYEEWEQVFSKVVSTMEHPPRLEYGLFQIGANKYVDKLVFKCGIFDAVEGLPYTLVEGKKLKKGPETYKDIRDKVLKDYIAEHQNDWLNELKTVNNGGSY